MSHPTPPPSWPDRLGLTSLQRLFLDHPGPAAAPWRAFLFGSVLGALLLLTTTGVALAAFYAPSTTDAWASVLHLEKAIPGGAWLRALHLHATSAVLVLLALHLSGFAIAGAWKTPREGQWWASLALVLVVLGAAMTGALLPWDQKGYWASQVETGIMASAPVAGDLVRAFVVGGNDLGNLTLTRYFAAHALLIPVALGLVLAALLGLRRLHGETPSNVTAPLPWWPVRAFPQLMGGAVAIVALGIYAALEPAPLDGPADPTSGFPARPAWYFRALFVLRKPFEGPLEPVATMVIPGLIAGLLVALPLLDRKSGGLRARLAVVLPVPLLFVAVALATAFSFHKDADDAGYQAAVKGAEATRGKAMTLAAAGVPAEGPLFMLRNTPEERGKRLFEAKCAGCHPVSNTGGKDAPDLGGYGSIRWLTGLIAHPESPDYFGKTKVEGMDPYEELGPEKLGQLATFVKSLGQVDGVAPEAWPASLAAGRAQFEEEGCDSCHPLSPGVADAAPNLNGWGSDAWITRLLDDAGTELFFGDADKMPAYKDKFDERQKADVIAYLRVLESAPTAAEARAAAPPAAP